MRISLKDAGLALWAVLAALLLAQSLWRAVHGSHDLVYVLDVTRVLLEGRNPFRAYLEWRGGTGPMPAFQDTVEGYEPAPNYLPSGLAFILPLAALAPSTATIVWALCNLGFALVAAWAAARFLVRHGWRLQAALALAFLTSIPVGKTIAYGQFGIAALALLLAAWILAERKARAGAALCLAAALMKYTLTGPPALIFLRRGFAVLAGAGAVHILALLGLALHLDISPLTLMLEAAQATRGFTATGDMDYASLLSFFGSGGVTIGIALSALVAVGCIIVSLRRTPDDPLQALAFYSLIAAMVVYHRDYDAVILLLPLAYGARAWAAGWPHDTAARIAVGGSLIAPLMAWYGVPLARLARDGLPAMGGAAVMAWTLFALAASAAIAAHMVLLWRGPVQDRAAP